MSVAGPRPLALKQQRDLGQIIEVTFEIFTQNFMPLLTIAAVVVPIGIASGVLQEAIDDPAAAALVVLALVVLQFVASLLALAALIVALSDIDAGRGVDFSRAYDAVFARFWTVIGAALRAIVVVVLLAITLIGLPFALYLGIRWLFIQQAVILDGTSAKAALSYSADAVSGRWWRTLGIAILIALIVGVPSSIVSGLFSLAPPLVSSTVSAALNAALLPFSAIAMSLLYLDLQTRKESDVANGLA